MSWQNLKINDLILAGLVPERLVGVCQLLLHLPACAVGLLKHGARLLQRILVGVRAPVSREQVVVGCRLCPTHFLIASLEKSGALVILISIIHIYIYMYLY